MKGSFDKGWNFGCLQVCLSLAPTPTHPQTLEDTHAWAFTHSSSLLHYYRDKEKNKRQSRRGGGGERAGGTPCPALPLLIAWAIGRAADGQFCVCVCWKSRRGGASHQPWLHWAIMMQPPTILILEEEKPAGVGWLAGSQNLLINYVMEKCPGLLRVWGSWM